MIYCLLDVLCSSFTSSLFDPEIASAQLIGHSVASGPLAYKCPKWDLVGFEGANVVA